VISLIPIPEVDINADRKMLPALSCQRLSYPNSATVGVKVKKLVGGTVGSLLPRKYYSIISPKIDIID
jgi:hypothetical protein